MKTGSYLAELRSIFGAMPITKRFTLILSSDGGIIGMDTKNSCGFRIFNQRRKFVYEIVRRGRKVTGNGPCNADRFLGVNTGYKMILPLCLWRLGCAGRWGPNEIVLTHNHSNSDTIFPLGTFLSAEYYTRIAVRNMTHPKDRRFSLWYNHFLDICVVSPVLGIGISARLETWLRVSGGRRGIESR